MISTGICRWLFLLISLSTWTKLTDSKEMRVVCYYTNWSVYRPGPAKFSPQNINPYLCTHLVYAFGGFTKENNLKPFDKYQDIEKGGYAKFTGLKTYNKNLKTLIAIGGWNEGSSRFSPMVANAERRRELVKNTIKFLRQNHFDGLDLDWEYPSFRDGGKERDRDNYAQLVQELREEFDRESEKTGRTRLLLTMAVPAGIEYINKGYDVPKLMKYLDWMNILSYDYHSAYEPSVNHHAPLFSLEEESEYNFDTELNIDYTIKHYLKKGALPEKLVLGIPTYGRSYTLFNPDASEIGAPADGPGDMGEYTRENGYLAYYEICEFVKDQSWEVVQPNPDAMGPYAYKDKQWVGYDDEDIVRKKAEYVVERGLGGIMFWAIDNDDFRGTCHGRPYPLIEAAKEAMINAYGQTDDNLISPPSKPSKPKTKSRTRTPPKSTSSDSEQKTTRTKPKTSSSTGRRRRVKSKTKSEERSTTERPEKKRQEPTSYSSLSVITPAYTTPEPPSTPDQGGAFKCEDEGFFPHPKDCKKYFWCLSGAGDSGIIAHQFTCPAGLYFNKAADSCDYTQNVLCNKKLQKATTTTAKPSTSESSTKASTAKSSTTRAPSKITAATSRTTFKQTTTTEKYEDEEEYEYEDEEEDEAEDSAKSEEDPRVIKELIDLIRKVGGIEELEKQLNGGSKSTFSSGPDATTQSAISKSLYERVLAKAGKNTLNALKSTARTPGTLSRNRNSGGPQSNGLEKDEKSSSKERGRPQYKTITRQRASTEKAVEEKAEAAEEVVQKEKPQRTSGLFRTKLSPEYVNIRRGRVSTTPEPDDDKNNIPSESEDEEIDDDEEDSRNPIQRSRSTTPKYVSIRRQRPSTTETPSTSKYVELRRRPTTASTEAPEEATEDSSKRYQTIRRGTTTTTSSIEEVSTAITRPVTNAATEGSESQIYENTSSKYANFIRGSTTASSTTSGDNDNEVTEKPVAEKLQSRPTTTSTESPNTTPSSEAEINAANITAASSQESQSVASIKPEQTSSTDPQIKSIAETTENAIESDLSTEKTPLLSQPRPFSTRPSKLSTEQPPKVSQTNLKSRVRSKVAEDPSTTEPPSLRSRVRGSSRFSVTNRNIDETTSTQAPVNRRRRPLPTTTEKTVDSNEAFDRNYRPSELSDLSSLTAADVNVRDFNSIPGSQRRRRPVATPTRSSISIRTTSPPTTEKNAQVTKANSLRSLPLARKLAEKSKKSNDLINSGSESRVRIRGFRTTTEEARDVETTTNDSLTRTTRAGSSTTPLPRARKVIRRLRPTPPSKTISSTATANNTIIETTTVYNLLRKRILLVKPKQNQTERVSPPPNQDDKEEALSSDEISEEGENIKLSESNIRENSDVNSFDTSRKQRRKFVKLVAKSKADSLHLKLGDDEKSTTPKETVEVTPSSSPDVVVTTIPTTTEAEQTNNQTTISTTEQVQVTTTSEEPATQRRRKVIRKIKPTESKNSNEDNQNKDDADSKRKRKVIRRLRPASDTNSLVKQDENKDSLGAPKFYVRGSRGRSTTTPISTTTIESSTTKIVDEPVAQRLQRPSVSRRRNRFDKTEEQKTDENNFGTKRVRIQRPVTEPAASSTQASRAYGRRRGTTTPATTTEEQKIEATISPGRLRAYTRPSPSTTEAIKAEELVGTTQPGIVSSSTENVESGTERSTEEEEKETEKPQNDIPDSSTLASTTAYKIVETKIAPINDTDDKKVEGLTPPSRLKAYTRPPASTEAIDKSAARTPKYKYRFDEDDHDDDTFHHFSTIDDHDDMEPFMSTPEYSYYSSPITERDRDEDEEEDEDEDFDPENDRDEMMDDDEEEAHPEENPKYLSYRKTTTTKKSHHFESSINFNDENEQDKDDDSVKENMSLNSTIVRSNQNIHNTSTLTVPDMEGGTDNPNVASDEITTISPEKVNSTEKNNLANKTDSISTSTSPFPETTEISNEIFETTLYPTTFDAKTSSSFVVVTTVEPPTEILNTTQASTEHSRRSTLRPVQGRPSYIVPKRNQNSTTSSTTSTEPSIKQSTKRSKLNANKFTRSRFQKSTTERTPSRSRVGTSTSTPINRKIYRYTSTIERTTYTTEDTKDFDDIPYEPYFSSDEDDSDERPFKRPNFIKPFFTQKSTTESIKRKTNSPIKSQAGKSSNKILDAPKPTLTSTTEQPKEDNIGIDTDAIKNRNKNLFSKRKMNTPFVVSSTTTTTTTTTTVPPTTESTLTTLHHVFADVSDSDSTDNTETTTEINNKQTTTSKMERLVEVNRIIEVSSKEAKGKNHSGIIEGETKLQVIPTIDKIGAVSRVTHIEIVDGNNITTIQNDSKKDPAVSVKNNETTSTSSTVPSTTFVPVINLNGDIVEVAKVEEVPAPVALSTVNLRDISIKVQMPNDTQREDRKFDIISAKSKPSDNALSDSNVKPEIIDGRSHIKIVTPKVYGTAASTISLQGLFTEAPTNHLNPSFTSNDELLETEHSKYVDVRVLKQDADLNKRKVVTDKTKIVPIKILEQDEEVTLKARVVEVTPRPKDTIRIVPIQVQMSRKVAENLPIYRVQKT